MEIANVARILMGPNAVQRRSVIEHDNSRVNKQQPQNLGAYVPARGTGKVVALYQDQGRFKGKIIKDSTISILKGGCPPVVASLTFIDGRVCQKAVPPLVVNTAKVARRD